MGTASCCCCCCESLLSPPLPPSSGLLRLGTYVPLLPLRVLFLRNATRLGLDPRPRDEGSGLESRRSTVQTSLGASTTGASTLCRARCVGRRAAAAAAAAASGCVIPVDGKDDDSDSESTLPLGGKEAAPALELTLVLALIPRSPERFRMAIGREEEAAAEDAFRASRKSSGHLPLPRLIRSMPPVLSSEAPASSSDSSTTRNRSTGTVSLGLRSRGRTVGPSRLRLRPPTWPFGLLFPYMLAAISPGPSSQPNMDAAIALPSVRVMLGHSDGMKDVASVVTVRIVPNFPFP